MPGAEQTIGGPVVLILQFLRWVVPAAGFLLAIDAVRRPARDFPGRFSRVARWAWALPQLFFILLVLIGVSLPGSMALAVSALLLSFVMLGLQIAYLLRVVFPSPARLEKRREAATAAQPADAGNEHHIRPNDPEER